MEFVKAKFPAGLPTLQELKDINVGTNVPPETAWIWGESDEVRTSAKMWYETPKFIFNLL